MMEPIPVSRALVPVYPDLPAEKISVADRLFEKEKSHKHCQSVFDNKF